MRDTKFRVWCGRNMFYGDLEGFIDWDENKLRPRNNCKLMQFIGLLDKNGKEIYEGDVVKFDTNYGGRAIPIELIDSECGFNIDKDFAEGCEIIGNIYEHPELLTTPQ